VSPPARLAAGAAGAAAAAAAAATLLAAPSRLAGGGLLPRVAADGPQLTAPAPAPLPLARSSYGVQQLVCLGGFQNQRQEFSWGGHTLELDETKYEWGTLYEIECETVRAGAPRGKAGRGLGPGVWGLGHRRLQLVQRAAAGAHGSFACLAWFPSPAAPLSCRPPVNLPPLRAGQAGAAARAAGGVPGRGGRGVQVQHHQQVRQLQEPHAGVRGGAGSRSRRW
jgi:hypothetical protein